MTTFIEKLMMMKKSILIWRTRLTPKTLFLRRLQRFKKLFQTHRKPKEINKYKIRWDKKKQVIKLPKRKRKKWKNKRKRKNRRKNQRIHQRMVTLIRSSKMWRKMKMKARFLLKLSKKLKKKKIKINLLFSIFSTNHLPKAKFRMSLEKNLGMRTPSACHFPIT